MLDCTEFEELISDYLECGLARAERRSFAEHLLACRDCHTLFNDVREAMTACHSLRDAQMREIAEFVEIRQRIINATTVGEMLSCRTLDALISDYFDGLIDSNYESLFTDHFAACDSCRRLVDGVRESLAESEAVEVPEQLYYRIIAATSGARR
ncbi:MAG TPA: zf-HC2 domain-containing protein [Blastocatellia bacterium]|nr:zf-HC2 domain-containing protein [Blastocatellia bacterium]